MNTIRIIERLMSAGFDPKDAVAAAIVQMRHKAQFFSKLREAQQNLGRIIKDTRDQRGRNYAGVDQFVGKAQRALNEAGLTLFEHETAVVAKGEKERHWQIECVIGDTQTGYSLPLRYEVPINPQAWSKEPEKAVGSADSYALKYLTRGALFAERSEHDPDRHDDPDHAGYDRSNDKPRAKPNDKPSPAATKKKTPKKPTAQSRKKAAQARLKGASSHLGKEIYDGILAENPMSSLEAMETLADVLDARIRLEQIKATATKRFGEDQVNGWLELFRPFTQQTNIVDAIKALATELNGGKE